jgi:spore coat protein H
MPGSFPPARAPLARCCPWAPRLLVSPLLLLAGCVADDDGPLPPAIACEVGSQEGVDPVRGVSFAAEDLACLNLELPAEDFQALAASNSFGMGEPLRNVVRHLTRDCTTPFPSAYPWFEADLRAGQQTLSRVGVRKKGFLGSVTGHGMSKPSIVIKTDAHVAGQSLGMDEHVTLNNGAQDFTRVRTCLAYEVFASAGYPAPRCNIAALTVNGEPRGAYVHVEPIRKAFLRRTFGNDAGSLYEGTVVDLTPEFLPVRGSLGRWEVQTQGSDPSGAPLFALRDALLVSDGQLLAEVARHVNVERFLTYWALEIIVDHADGYTANRNNFFVYFDPADGGRAHFLPWGADDLFRPGSNGYPRPFVDYAFAELPRRLSWLPEISVRLEAEIRRLLATVWDEEQLLAKVESYADQVRRAEAAPYYDIVVENLTTWISRRREQLETSLTEGFPSGPPEPPSCFTVGLNEGLGAVQEIADGVTTLTFTW